MPKVYKRRSSKPIPKEAKIVTQNGKKVARYKGRDGKPRTAEVTVSKTGELRILLQSDFYFARFRDHENRVVERSTKCKNKEAAQNLVAEWLRKVEKIRSGVLTVDEVQIAEHKSTSIGDHVDQYLIHITPNSSANHRTSVSKSLQRVIDAECIARLRDISPEKLESYLTGDEVADRSPRTRNVIRQHWLSFCGWCVKTGKLASNPIKTVPKSDETDVRRKRRALTDDELGRLLVAASERPFWTAKRIKTGPNKGQFLANLTAERVAELRLTGRKRALIYLTLATTGLRKSELESITIGQCHLGDIPYIELNAKDAKSKKAALVPLRRDVANQLKDWIQRKREAWSQDKTSGSFDSQPLFQMAVGLIRSFYLDLEWAGIPKLNEQGERIDIHALRHTFATRLAKSGVSQRKTQELMRHSDPKLTANVYTQLGLDDTSSAIEQMNVLVIEDNRSSPFILKDADSDADNSDTAIDFETIPDHQQVAFELTTNSNKSTKRRQNTVFPSDSMDSRKSIKKSANCFQGN